MSALAELRAADATIDGAGPRLSLAPGRARATSLESLVDDLGEDLEGPVREALAQGLVAIAQAQLRSFPENLLWDLDALAASLAESGRAGGVGGLRQAAKRMVDLEDLFGGHTTINFRYAHDFLYGFDWAKWVARDPRGRGRIGPFDGPFLEALFARGRELLSLIDQDDQKYPRLPSGVRRNPFPFSREPEDELRLHRSLAAARLLPVESWSKEARPDWNRAYIQLREREAARLGLGLPPTG